MELQSIRTLNLIGTILFGLFGSLIPLYYGFSFGLMFWYFPGGDEDSTLFSICISIIVIWIVAIIILAIQLYRKTVVGLDKGEYESAKRWVIVGVILGFIFAGIIPFILFLISIVLFDEAVRRAQYPYYYPPPYYPPPYYPPPYYPPPYYPPPSYPHDYPYPESNERAKDEHLRKEERQ